MMNNMSAEDARWMALFVDTEGTVHVAKQKRLIGRKSDRYYPVVSVANACMELLEEAKRIVGIGNIYSLCAMVNVPVYRWQISGRKAADFLRQVYPFLMVKKRQARIAIYLNYISRLSMKRQRLGLKRGRLPLTQEDVEIRHKLWKQCSKCNKHGNPNLSWIPEPGELFLT